jgi:cell division protein FtsQ
MAVRQVITRMQITGTANRADQIRKKHDQRPRKRATKPSRRIAKTAATTRPPVLVRGGLVEPLSQDRRRNRAPKRRYDVALGATGAEMRLPSLPRVAVGWRLLSFILLIALGVGIYFLWTASLFQVQNFEVQGLLTIDSQKLDEVAQVVGKSILLVDSSKIQSELVEAFPEVENLEVKVGFPAQITVSGVERRPVLTWIQEGKTYWVDSAGTAYPARGEGGPALTVEATGVSTVAPQGLQGKDEPDKPVEPMTVRQIPVSLVNAILRMSEAMPANTPLFFDNIHGLGWKDPKGWMAYFGTDVDNIETKLSMYRVIFKKLKKDGVKPEFISVEFINAPYYRLEP